MRSCPTIQLKDGEKPMAETKGKGVACGVGGDTEAEVFWQELKTLCPRKAFPSGS